MSPPATFIVTPKARYLLPLRKTQKMKPAGGVFRVSSLVCLTVSARRLEPEQSLRPQNVSMEEDLPDRSGPPSDIPGLVPASKHQEKVPDVPNTSSSVMVPDTSSRSPKLNPGPPLSQWSPYLEKRKSTQESDSYSKKRRLLSGDASADVMHQSIYPPLSPYVHPRGSPGRRIN